MHLICRTYNAWVEENEEAYDFNTYGWPAWYPTRTLDAWEKVRTIWAPYVFREAGVYVQVPQDSIIYSKRKTPRKNTKFEHSKKYFTREE